jgi:hypothetical protein
MVMSSKYTDEERAAVLAAGRQAIADADAVLDKPRPDVQWPPIEDRVAKWKREADEQAARFAAERREWTLTETEAQRLEHRLVAQIGAGLGEQKAFLLEVLANVIAEIVAEFESKIAELSAEIGQLRADQTVHRALAKGEPGGDVVDLPQLPLRKRVA